MEPIPEPMSSNFLPFKSVSLNVKSCCNASKLQECETKEIGLVLMDPQF